MMDRLRNLSRCVVCCALIGVLASCTAAHTAITKRDLNVQTKMSETVFLDPVAPDKKVVFIQIRNTSGVAGLNIEPQLKAAIAAHGYRFTDNPDAAHYLLQANI